MYGLLPGVYVSRLVALVHVGMLVPRLRNCRLPAWLHLRLQLTYPAHPDMLSAHRNEGYEAELKPGTRLSSKHGGIITSWTDSRSLVSLGLYLSRTTKCDWDAKEAVHARG